MAGIKQMATGTSRLDSSMGSTPANTEEFTTAMPQGTKHMPAMAVWAMIMAEAWSNFIFL